MPFIGLFLSDPGANPSYRADGAFFLPLFLVYFAPSLVAGIGLLFNARWARILLFVQAVAYLVLVPLGTALGIATLAVLLLDRTNQAKPDNEAPPSYDAKPTTGPAAAQSLRAIWDRPLGSVGGVLAAMAIVGPGFIVAIDLLWHHNEPHTPPELDQAALIALPIMLIAIVVLVRSILISDGGSPYSPGIDFFYARRRRWQRESRLLTQEEHRRVKRLAADPALRKYADLIRNGQHWSDVQIAYDRDPTALITCAHIQPIERAMREAGILVRPLYGSLVSATCCVDGRRLQDQFSIQLPVWFSDDIPGDRPYDPEGAAIMCREHQSGIWLLHPREAKPDTPVFPAR